MQFCPSGWYLRSSSRTRRHVGSKTSTLTGCDLTVLRPICCPCYNLMLPCCADYTYTYSSTVFIVERCSKIHTVAVIHKVFCIAMLGRSQPSQRCNAQSLVFSQWPRCIKACILMLPHQCYINTEQWDASMVLPCSSAAQPSYNDITMTWLGLCNS